MPWTPPASAITWQDFPNLSTAVSAAHLNQAEGYAVTVGQSVVDYEETVRPTVLLDNYYDSAVYANKTAAIQAAVTAAIAGRAVLECQAKRVYSLDTAQIDFPPNSPLTIEGHGATWQSNYGKPIIHFFARTADNQTWTDVDVRDLIFDANNATAAVGTSVVGNKNFAVANTQQRTNFQRVYYRRCKWINVHTAVSGDGTAPVSCFDLQSSQLFNDQPEAQNTITDIHVEQARARGGNYGFIVNGTSSGGNAAVNVYLDQIYLEFDWDSGVVQSGTFQSGGNQIGSFGYGDYCEVRAIIANGGDANLEIDGMQTAHVWGRSTDARNANYYCRNFHAPPDILSQRYIYHGCEARVVALNPSTANPWSVGFLEGAIAASTPNPGFGEMVLEDCKFISNSVNMTMAGSALQVAQVALANALTIVGKFTASYPNVNDANAGGSAVRIAPGTSGPFVLSGGDIRVSYAGTGGAGGIVVAVDISPGTGCAMVLDFGAMTSAPGLASQGNGRDRGLNLGVSGIGGGTMRGRIRKVGWDSYASADASPHLVTPAASTLVSIDGRLVIDELDLRKDPVAAPPLLGTQNGMDVTNQAKIAVRSANMGTYPIASAAMGASNFAAATFTSGVGNQYIGGLPAEIHCANGTGAGITLIDVSKDGTTYENAYTQASGAMAQSVIVPVENGDFVKVTFATTQPTTRVRYRRAQ